MGGCAGAVAHRATVSALRRFFCTLRPTVDGRPRSDAVGSWISPSLRLTNYGSRQRLFENHLPSLRSDGASGCRGRLWGDTSTGRAERRAFGSRDQLPHRYVATGRNGNEPARSGLQPEAGDRNCWSGTLDEGNVSVATRSIACFTHANRRLSASHQTLRQMRFHTSSTRTRRSGHSTWVGHPAPGQSRLARPQRPLAPSCSCFDATIRSSNLVTFARARRGPEAPCRSVHRSAHTACGTSCRTGCSTNGCCRAG